MSWVKHVTFARYLGVVNFPNGNAYADPNVALPDEMYFVDRKATENSVMIEWELTSAIDLVNIKLPRRQVIANTCPWKYRGVECGYTGGAVADEYDKATTDVSKDKCGKRLASCKLRFGAASDNLRYGGFPAAQLVK
ncbi:MAG: phage minor tail protein L [Candidatus Accumulibacter sp.]|nr:phage minor tail protein L [Accumulibacter sp.]